MATAAIGQPISRKDGVAKVTGAARYAADFTETGMAYAQLVTSTVAKGRIAELDTSAAEAAPGVLLVLTHRNMERIEPLSFFFAGGPAQSSFMPLTSDEVHYGGQAIALVVAETQEAGDDAARRVEVAYRAEPAATSIHDQGAGAPADAAEAIEISDAEAAFAAAEVKVDALYTTPAQHHNPIELYATTASWQGANLTVYLPSQWVRGTQHGLAKAFGLRPDDVQVISPYVGGAFGSKATIMSHTVLVAAAARRLGRPVKLMVSREDMYAAGSFRPATTQRVALAAARDGRLQALIHEQRGQTSRMDQACFPGTEMTARMYAVPNIRTREMVIATDVNAPGFMRAPFETPTFFGLESAMDELAVALGMDPVELRILNEPDKDPTKGLAWSSRSLVQCYRRGAERFGWSRRTPEPGSMREGDDLIGWGCATATYPTQLFPTSARLRLAANGSASVGCAAHDIGTGTYTIAAQIVADRFGIPMDQVTVELGDSRLPTGPVAGGSVTAGSIGGALVNARDIARDRLLQAAAAEGRFAGVPAMQLRLEDGEIVGPNGAREPLAAILNRIPPGVMEAEASWVPGRHDGGAGRDGESGRHGARRADLSDVQRRRLWRRVRRGADQPAHPDDPRAAHGRCVRGRAHPQRQDRAQPADGRHGLGAQQRAPRGDRDRPQAGAVRQRQHRRVPRRGERRHRFGRGRDAGREGRAGEPLGAKGIGELGIVGTSAAIAKAVYHATGIRVRKTPILIEDILPQG